MSLFDVYPLMNMEPAEAKGSFIWDKNGKRYLDLYGGHAVISIGHSHPHYIKRLSSQLNKIGFYSNSVINALQTELADKISALSGYGSYNLFLCNSGAEANENALKIASFFNNRKKIISFKKSFHGRTSAAVSITDDVKLSAPVNKNDNVIFLPMNDIEALNTALYDNKVCAVIIEGIQGVGGINVPTESFLKRARVLCDYTGALLILDEVQSGCGRTGKFYAHQHSNIKPDVITIAKGMGNGFPVAGALIHKAIEAKHGMLGSTFGGNHLACIAAIAVLEVIENEGLMENALEKGNYLMNALNDLEGVKEVRGKGLMIGVEFKYPCEELRNKLFSEHQILTGTSSNKNTLRILPSLNLRKQDADYFLEAMNKILADSPVGMVI
jgi:acetylornithine/N-succinyldiaminopimelate aminotransferase